MCRHMHACVSIGRNIQQERLAEQFDQEHHRLLRLRGRVSCSVPHEHVDVLRVPLVARVASRTACAVGALIMHKRWPVLGLAHRSDLAGLLVHVPVRHDSTVSPVLPELHKLHSNPTGPMKADGTLDKRYKANRL